MAYRNIPRYISIAAISTTIAVFGAMYLLMPYFSDDFWYMEPLRPFIEGTADTPDFGAVFDSIAYHYRTDNARLSNAFFTILICLPRPVLAILSTLLTGASLVALMRLARVELHQWQAVVWMCLLFAATLPWYDGMFALCFQFNYVWGMAGLLGVLALFLSGRLDRRRAMVPAFLLGLLVGGWHEGFSVPAFCACAALTALWPRRYINEPRLALLAGLAAGILWLVTAPSFFRYTEESPMGMPDLMARLYRTMRVNIFCFAGLALALAALWRKRTRAEALAPANVACLAACLVGLMIYAYALFFYRVAFPAQLMAIPLIVGNSAILFNEPRRRWRLRAGAVCTALAGLFLLVHYAFALEASVAFRTGMTSAQDKDEFVDFAWTAKTRFLALGKPYGPDREAHLATDGMFRRQTGRPPLHLAPAELEYVTAESGRAVPGTPGLREWAGLYFIPAEKLEKRPEHAPMPRICFGGRYHTTRNVIVIPFTSQADGREYCCLFIQEIYPIGRILPVTSIEWNGHSFIPNA